LIFVPRFGMGLFFCPAVFGVAKLDKRRPAEVSTE